MKIDIILCGVGGMGALSSAAIISKAALEMGMYMKQAETHGMSQRGGDVQSHLRLSDKPIASDLIPEESAISSFLLSQWRLCVMLISLTRKQVGLSQTKILL